MQTTLEAQIRRLLALINLAASRNPPFLRWLNHYRPDKNMDLILGRELSRPTRWITSEGETRASGELADIFFATNNVHKWLHYLPIYESVFSALRAKPIRFLEIGVARGGSLAIWRRYFPAETLIVGIDFDETCRQFDDPTHNVHVRIGRQQDIAFLRSVVDELGPFDVILDDGGHMFSHMIDSFRFLFPAGLADGGVYLVEDLHCNYWTSYRDGKISFIDFAKSLIDVMHAHYWNSASELEFRSGFAGRRREFKVPAATVILDSIEFHDSIAVFRRARSSREVPFSVHR